MSGRDQKNAAKIVAASMLCLFGGVLLIGYTAWSYPRRPHREGDIKKIVVVVSRGMTTGAIARALAEHDVIDHPTWFRFYAVERGDAQKVKPGRYSFSPSMAPSAILDALVAGLPDEMVGVTLPEGKNILEVAALLDEAGVCTRDEFMKAVRDPVLLRQHGVPGESFEGYLFPDRYFFRPATPASKVINRLVSHAREVFAEVREKRRAALDTLKRDFHFDDHKVVLMASLIEKETGEPSERPRIAGVFYNRLRMATFKPHLLQTDPTIVYGCTVPVAKSAACAQLRDRIRRIHLDDRDNPYNTYTHEGLPPGPISNPGRAALEAAMQPENTAFLYFVSRNDGTHIFSKSRAEHEAAVDKFQRHHDTL